MGVGMNSVTGPTRAARIGRWVGASLLAMLSMSATSAFAQETLRWPTRWAWGTSSVFHPLYNPASYPMSSSLALYNGLTRLDPTQGYAPVPDLAESWTVSEDGLTYTFKLRPGVKFHDGSFLTADDVLFTFAVAADPAQALNVFSDVAPIESVTAPDQATVVFKLKYPYGAFLTNVGIQIMPKAIVEPQMADGTKLAETAFARAPIGTGPYKFAELKPGQELILEANPDYHFGAPQIDRIVFVLGQDSDSVLLRLQAGEFDGGLITPAYYQSLDPAQYKAVVFKSASANPILLNTKLPPFDDVRVRKALNLALDKTALAALVNAGLSVDGGSPLPSTHWDSTDLSALAYDPEGMAALLTEAGYARNGAGIWEKDGQPLAIEINDAYGFTTIADAVASQWLDAGIEATVKPTTFGEVWPVIDTVPALTYQFGAPQDPDSVYFLFHSTATIDKGGFNAGRYTNPDVDAALDAGRAALTFEDRKPFYDAFQAALLTDPPYAWAVNTAPVMAFSSRLSGYSPDITVSSGDEVFWNIEDWTLAAQ